MPTRRTSPRRGATRPINPLIERDVRPPIDDDYDDEPGALAGAAPWLAILALVLAAATLGYVLFLRPGGGSVDLTACRNAAWTSVPDINKLPEGWNLGSTDLNANGMTISVLGPGQPDSESDQPVVVASITCYGDSAEAALTRYRDAAKASSSTVTDRQGGADAFDVTSTAGSVTTLFRVGNLVGQVADGGSTEAADRQTITEAVALAMGDGRAAGTAAAEPSDDANQGEPSDTLGSDEPSEPPFAPELEAAIPTTITDPATATAVTLTKVSGSGTDLFGTDVVTTDPIARALTARLRDMGGTLDKLEVAQAFDDTGTVDLRLTAFRLPGADLAKLRSAIIDTWLGASATGVKKTDVSLGGRSLIKIDYGDGSPNTYLYANKDYVIVIDASDEALVTVVAKALK